MKTLIYSHKHYLAPLAWRLSREGEDVSLVTLKKRYQGVWSGRLPQAIEGGADIQPDHPDLKPWVESAALGETRVITDVKSAVPSFSGSTHFFYTLKMPAPSRENYNLVLGAWWDGTTWQLPHWYLPEWGLFPGGLGSEVIAGGTILRGSTYPLDLLQPLEGPLTEAGFKGLVGLGVRYVESSGKLEPTQMFTAGWGEWLHWELALGELESLNLLLTHGDHHLGLPPFTVGIVVSQPPWPSVGFPTPPSVDLTFTPEVTKKIFFHDINIVEGKITTCGADGLVGVARGSGRSLAKARQVALVTADAIRFPERQLRPDVGAGADNLVVALEQLGYW